ncbi:hypothetical protein PMIN03_003485 [Paraphaeosphaeria minitans]
MPLKAAQSVRLHDLTEYTGIFSRDPDVLRSHIELSVPGYSSYDPATWPRISRETISQSIGCQYDGSMILPGGVAAYNEDVMRLFLDRFAIDRSFELRVSVQKQYDPNSTLRLGFRDFPFVFNQNGKRKARGEWSSLPLTVRDTYVRLLGPCSSASTNNVPAFTFPAPTNNVLAPNFPASTNNVLASNVPAFTFPAYTNNVLAPNFLASNFPASRNNVLASRNNVPASTNNVLASTNNVPASMNNVPASTNNVRPSLVAQAGLLLSSPSSQEPIVEVEQREETSSRSKKLPRSSEEAYRDILLMLEDHDGNMEEPRETGPIVTQNISCALEAESVSKAAFSQCENAVNQLTELARQEFYALRIELDEKVKGFDDKMRKLEQRAVAAEHKSSDLEKHLDSNQRVISDLNAQLVAANEKVLDAYHNARVADSERKAGKLRVTESERQLGLLDAELTAAKEKSKLLEERLMKLCAAMEKNKSSTSKKRKESSEYLGLVEAYATEDTKRSRKDKQS